MPHRAPVTQRKAKQVLREGRLGGQKLTEKQKRFFGLIAGGGHLRQATKKRRRR